MDFADKTIPLCRNLSTGLSSAKYPNCYEKHTSEVTDWGKRCDTNSVLSDISGSQCHCESGNEGHVTANSSSILRSPISSRVPHLNKRTNRLKHKIRKLQMCQIGFQVDSQAGYEKLNRAKSSFLIMRKMRNLPQDSDDTDSDSSSCNENSINFDSSISSRVEDRNLQITKRYDVDKFEATKEQLSNRFGEQNASSYNRWQWLQFQIQSLEIKILQTNETLRKVRSQEFKSKFESIPFAISADGTTDETIIAARIRGLKSHPQKKPLSTLNIITQSKNELPLCGIPCSCPPNLCCILCGGPGVLHLQNPSSLSDFCYRRVEIVHPSYHKVICDGKIPLSVQYGRLIKGRKWTSRGSNSKNAVFSAKIEAVSSENSFQTKKIRPTQLQKLLEVKKRTRSKKAKRDYWNEETPPKSTHQVDLSRPLADVNEFRNVNKGNTSDSKRTSRSSSPGLSKADPKTLLPSIIKDLPYIPDLSESSGDSSGGELCRSSNDMVVSKSTFPNSRNILKTFNVVKKDSGDQETYHRATPKSTIFDVFTNEIPPESKVSGNGTPINTATLKKNCLETENREDIVIPLSNSLPLFEPVIYKTIETPQWRTKWIDPLPMKNVGLSRQETLEEMSEEKYAALHYRFEHEENIKSAGLHRRTNQDAIINSLASKTEVRSLASSEPTVTPECMNSGPYEKRDFPLTQRQLLDFNKTVATRNHDFFDVL